MFFWHLSLHYFSVVSLKQFIYGLSLDDKDVMFCHVLSCMRPFTKLIQHKLCSDNLEQCSYTLLNIPFLIKDLFFLLVTLPFLGGKSCLFLCITYSLFRIIYVGCRPKLWHFWGSNLRQIFKVKLQIYNVNYKKKWFVKNVHLTKLNTLLKVS